MGSDNRDWHRDWWRKRMGYVERARFRLPEVEYQRRLRSAARRRLFFFLAFCLATFFLFPRLLPFLEPLFSR